MNDEVSFLTNEVMEERHENGLVTTYHLEAIREQFADIAAALDAGESTGLPIPRSFLLKAVRQLAEQEVGSVVLPDETTAADRVVAEGLRLPAQATPALLGRSALPSDVDLKIKQGGRITTAFSHEPDLFWLAPDFAELVLDAAADLTSLDWGSIDLPSDEAIVFFAQPISLDLAIRPNSAAPFRGEVLWTHAVRAVQWKCCVTSDGAPVLLLIAHEDEGPGGGRLLPGRDGNRAHMGTATCSVARLNQSERVGGMEPSRFLAAFAMLLAAPGVTEVTHNKTKAAPPKKRTRKGRSRSATTSAVRVVTLRPGSVEASLYDGEAGKTREWRHRWMVRGHWRMQPYASLGAGADGKPRRRRIWIAPYMKGPAEAPLLTGTKVVAVRPPRTPDHIASASTGGTS